MNSTKFKVLVLNIGCSNIKRLIYQGTPESVLCLDILSVPTPDEPNKILSTCEEIMRDVLTPDCIITTSFSNSVITETTQGVFRLHVQSHESDVDRTPPSYTETGYSNMFQTVAQRIGEYKDGILKRSLPVSAFVSAQLANEKEWNAWDWTHASNSGYWHQEKQQWIDFPELDKVISRRIVSPGCVIGQYLAKVPIMVGGHDTLFITANTPQAYISTDTYPTVSVPVEFFEPEDEDSDEIRWLLDPEQRLYKQLLFKPSAKFSVENYEKVAAFLSNNCDSKTEIVVVGPFAQTMAIYLADNSEYYVSVRPHAQHEEAAKFAMRCL